MAVHTVGTGVLVTFSHVCVTLCMQIVEAFGGKGYFVSDPAELLWTLKEALAQTVSAVHTHTHTHTRLDTCAPV